MIDERLQEQAALYALGAMAEEEVPAFEAALREDPQLRVLARELRTVAQAVAGTAPALQPPAAVKARLLLELDDGLRAPARDRPRRSWPAWAIAASLALACAASLWDSAGLRTRLSAQARRIDELMMSAELVRAENQDLRLAVARLRESNRLADIRIALLDSLLASEPKAVAVSVWDNDRQDGIFIVRNLKPPPANKDYQLWVIDPKYTIPVDAGVFRVDAEGNVRVDFRAKKPIAMASKFAVTIEKKGGSDIPTTTATVLVGS